MMIAMVFVTAMGASYVEHLHLDDVFYAVAHHLGPCEPVSSDICVAGVECRRLAVRDAKAFVVSGRLRKGATDCATLSHSEMLAIRLAIQKKGALGGDL